MNSLHFDRIEPKKIICPVILLVDSSANMVGERLARVNELLASLRKLLLDYNRGSECREARLSVMSFGTAAKWECFMLDPAQALPLIEGGGLCNMGDALSLLRDSLSKLYAPEGYMDYTLPTIVLISGDFSPTDDARAPLSALMKNGIFARSVRLSAYMSEDSELRLAEVFASSVETCLELSGLREAMLCLFPREGFRLPHGEVIEEKGEQGEEEDLRRFEGW